MTATCRGHPVLACLALVLPVLLADFVTGPRVRFPILYVLPVMLAGWLNKGPLAYSLAGALPVVGLLSFPPWSQADLFPMPVLNTTIKAAALAVVAYLVGRTAAQSRRLKVLEGILKICASCKRIQNEKGEFEPVEKYMSDRSAVLFSHSLCPECMKKLYPEFADDRDA